ncbi:MAG: alpha-L-rhamnosidase [Verrucomicrobia bacterium]|nr:MAG: alpha-L-rhamnosidase [Verrucomicrobiota bacterium]
MGLCHRLQWPDEFKTLTADRAAKGFNVVQIVAGLYPDMPPFDPRGANEAGFPWDTNYARIRPEHFDAADRRLRHLVDSGITPCLVGAWGYFMPWMGVEKAKQHWRYLIARYGAYPVVWCAAGEANLPYYLVKGFPFDDREQVKGWTQVMRYIRETDPFRRPLSVHPTGLGRLSARGAVEDESLLDFDMLQTGHGMREVLQPTVKTVRASYAASPVIPVINSEVCYEMLGDNIPAEIPRLMFWASIMCGAAGHTYGANGIWQCNRPGQPHGRSPHGGSYGKIPWNEAMKLPGSQQLGWAKGFLESFDWQRFEPQPDKTSWSERSQPQAWGDWIWFPEGDPRRDAPAEPRFFRRGFELPPGAVIKRAHLVISVDDKFTVWLNGKKVGSGADWRTPKRFEVSALLKPGSNVLAVRAENLPATVSQNPAGLMASLQIKLANGAIRSVLSDSDWRVSKTGEGAWNSSEFEDSPWLQATVIAKYGEGPWGELSADDTTIVPFTAGVADRVRVIYVPEPRSVRIGQLQPGAKYRVTGFDPVTGKRSRLTDAEAGSEGALDFQPPQADHDWVLALERLGP